MRIRKEEKERRKRQTLFKSLVVEVFQTMRVDTVRNSSVGRENTITEHIEGSNSKTFRASESVTIIINVLVVGTSTGIEENGNGRKIDETTASLDIIDRPSLSHRINIFLLEVAPTGVVRDLEFRVVLLGDRQNQIGSLVQVVEVELPVLELVSLGEVKDLTATFTDGLERSKIINDFLLINLVGVVTSCVLDNQN
jgi:hypothetical protein